MGAGGKSQSLFPTSDCSECVVVVAKPGIPREAPAARSLPTRESVRENESQ